MPSIAVIADVHHGSYWKGRFREDIIEALRESIQIAIDNKVWALIIAGDLYHSAAPHPDSYAEVIAELDKLDKTGFDTYILMGNHDLQRRTNALKPLTAVNWSKIHVVSEDTTIQVPSYVTDGEPYTLYMIPYRDKQGTYEGSRFASPSIGIGHAPVIGGMYNGVQVPPDDSCIPQHVLNSCNRWYLGHIHTPAQVGNVIIPGAVVQSSLADCGQDRFVWLQGKATDAPVPIKLTTGWTFSKIDLDFVTNKVEAKKQLHDLLSGKSPDTTVCSVQIRIAMEDLGDMDLEKLKLALKNKIVDIPAPIIVRRQDSRVSSVKLETPREEAVSQFIDATMPADRAARLKEKAKQLMGAMK